MKNKIAFLKKYIFVFFLIQFLIGCSKASIYDVLGIETPAEEPEISEEAAALMSIESEALEPLQVFIEMHTPSDEFQLNEAALGKYFNLSGVILSTHPIRQELGKHIDYGELTVTDPNAYKFKFVPDAGFRGTDMSGNLYLISDTYVTGVLNLLISVKNRAPETRPFHLVSKGLGCVSCHAQFLGTGIIASDFSKDLQVGGGDTNAPFLWNTSSTQNHYFGQHNNHLKSYKSVQFSPDTKLMIPHQTGMKQEAFTDCSNPSDPPDSTSLEYYVNCRFKIPPPKPGEGSLVKVRQSFKIGAPTEAQLLELREKILLLEKKE